MFCCVLTEIALHTLKTPVLVYVDFEICMCTSVFYFKLCEKQVLEFEVILEA